MVLFQESALLCILVVATLAIPNPDEKNDRVFDRELSDKEHYTNMIHNRQYDHEAFLGEEAKTFDQLPPEESRRRLSLIVDKIDFDKDGIVNLEELKDWIRYTQRRYLMEDVSRQWNQHVSNKTKEKIDWEDYRKNVFGFLDQTPPSSEEDDVFHYRQMLSRDRRRWSAADPDGDGSLTKEEFAAFLHPEQADNMRDIVVLETIDDIDKDHDGKISISEYIGDLYQFEPNEEEPDWVKNERLQFATYRDRNGDGFMDNEEVKNWILPPDFDHAEAEARHLIYEADSDSDHVLTKEEIMNNYDLFVGSQATDFGEALVRHDEF